MQLATNEFMSIYRLFSRQRSDAYFPNFLMTSFVTPVYQPTAVRQKSLNAYTIIAEHIHEAHSIKSKL